MHTKLIGSFNLIHIFTDGQKCWRKQGGRGGLEARGRECEIKCREESEILRHICHSIRPRVLGIVFKTHTVWMNNEWRLGAK